MEQETTNPPPLFSPTLTDYGSNSIKKQKLINEKKELDEQCIIQNANAKNPKFKEPPGCFPEKTHWDYVMAEMKWLATDFEDERKYKGHRVKRMVKAIQLYSKEQERLEKKKQEEIIKDKKIKARFITKHIKLFWDKIDKIVTYKHRSQLYQRRGELMDRHLQFMLKQTEDYTSRISKQLSNKEGVHVNSTPFLFAPGVSLRPYQLKGLDWLVSLYEQGLSGILADEMGLGKTIETISLLAYLAGTKGIWGPHLIIVPTSTILNWECEFKRFCPAFKILTYYGTLNERKEKRKGWTNPNSYHVCITSYQLAIKDVALFRRRKWVYMILDEAHNIKNFKSARWQTLLHFNTKRRLLLTGTPLQNSLMELWSLMHFLMPALFRSRGEFAFWFSNPLNTMVEGEASINSQLILRLHSVLRPFILRRLKNEVEKEMPKKYFHILYCSLSKRQKYLYEDYISRRSTKDMLKSGSFLSMMSVLMQLRKVCNHPDLFETRPIESPFVLQPIVLPMPHLVMDCTVQGVYNPGYNSCFRYSSDVLTDKRLEENDWRKHLVFLPLQTRSVSLFHLLPSFVDREYYSTFQSERIFSLQPSLMNYYSYIQRDCLGLSEKTDVTKYDSYATLLESMDESSINKKIHLYYHQYDEYIHMKQALRTQQKCQQLYHNNHHKCDCQPLYGSTLRELLTVYSRPTSYTTKEWSTIPTPLRYLCPTMEEKTEDYQELIRTCVCYVHPASTRFAPTIRTDPQCGPMIEFVDIDRRLDQEWEDYRLDPYNHMVYAMNVLKNTPRSDKQSNFLFRTIVLIEEEIDIQREIEAQKRRNPLKEMLLDYISSPCIYEWNQKKMISFPEKHLIEYDCGKFQMLSMILLFLEGWIDELLPKLYREGSRCLIFTQMSKMLDILEIYLNNHSYTYLRMDGSTSVEKRQRMMEQFNNDNRIFIFILSTRSGGLGVNLIGANTVIFYDSDWNPSMDSQAQDRAHRIGQTRDVHIYRLISESTIEENILKKANQKRYLNQLSLEEGQFTTNNFFKEFTIHDIIGLPPEENFDCNEKPLLQASMAATHENIEEIMNRVEDVDDAQAAVEAKKEAVEIQQQQQLDTVDIVEKEENSQSPRPLSTEGQQASLPASLATPGSSEKELEKERKERQLREEQSFEREQSRIKTELKTWAGKNSAYLKELEKKLPTVQRKCIQVRELYDPIPEVTPEALKAELDGLEEEERIWEEEQQDCMELAELEIRDKDNTPTCLECTGYDDVEMNTQLFLQYREDAHRKMELQQQ